VTCDAHHMTDVREDGLGVSTCIQNALVDAGVAPEEVSRGCADKEGAGERGGGKEREGLGVCCYRCVGRGGAWPSTQTGTCLS